MMPNKKIIVQKYGGSSLIDLTTREKVITHIKCALSDEYKLVIVVSAMGREGDPYATDTFIEHIQRNGNMLKSREFDLLLSCGEIISATTLSSMLNAREIDNVVLTGGQAGIITDGNFANAKIKRVDTTRLLDELAKYDVVIVAGFQGVTENGDITTLGRGGSDTTATALGVALAAEYIDIFTDVVGIMSADPRIVKNAERLLEVTYEEICNLTNQGAKIIHPRAVEIAMEKNIPIRVRSTFDKSDGTLVTTKESLKDYSVNTARSDRIITGITSISNLVQVKLNVDDETNNKRILFFKTLADNQITIDFINISFNEVTFTVAKHDLVKLAEIMSEKGYKPLIRYNCSKVSIVGAGIAGVPGLMAQISDILNKEKIEVIQSSDSHTSIGVLINTTDLAKTINALHAKFYVM
jgi:aspartate kinase